jgi:hypothetical protein
MVVLGAKSVQKEESSEVKAVKAAARLKEEEEFGVSEEITADVMEGLKIPRRYKRVLCLSLLFSFFSFANVYCVCVVCAVRRGPKI